MRDGFVKVAVATPNIRVADCQYNIEEIVKIARSAAKRGAKLLVLPELCVTAYTCADLFLQTRLLDSAERALEHFVSVSAELDMVTVLGLPVRHGTSLYNCAAVVCRGELLGLVPKTYIPNYGEYYEGRYFASAPQENQPAKIGSLECLMGSRLLFVCREMPSFVLAAELCEDLWTPVPPSSAHALAGATVIANLSASSEIVGKAEHRRNLVLSQSSRLISAYLDADAGSGESTTDVVFSGNHFIGASGKILAESKPFSLGQRDGDQNIIYSEIDLDRLSGERLRSAAYSSFNMSCYNICKFSLTIGKTDLTRFVDPHPFVPASHEERKERCETILSIQAHGLKQRIERAKAECPVIAVSGGLDSCLALLVVVRANDMLLRPRKNILAVTMPCFGTTKRTKTNAERLCAALGVTLRCIDIRESVELHFRDIGHDPKSYNVVYENAQARQRTQTIMNIANAENGLVIGTGDLSELALGWATYNGDHMSMYGVNASVPKTLVRHIVDYCADFYEEKGEKEIAEVLRDILATPVSPELLPARGDQIVQKTEDIVGPYELHDFYLYNMIRFGFSPKKLYRLALRAFEGTYQPSQILRWLEVFIKRFFAQQFKRSCMPDGPKVGTVSFSPRSDWRMPSDASAELWLAEIDELKRLLNHEDIHA